MTEWERFKLRAIHHTDQHKSFVQEALEGIDEKDRGIFLELLFGTGEIPHRHWKWLAEQRQRVQLWERLMRADGLMKEFVSLLE